MTIVVRIVDVDGAEAGAVVVDVGCFERWYQAHQLASENLAEQDVRGVMVERGDRSGTADPQAGTVARQSGVEEPGRMLEVPVERSERRRLEQAILRHQVDIVAGVRADQLDELPIVNSRLWREKLSS